MSDEQLAELFEALVAVKAKRPGVDKVFLRGFNAGIDFAIAALPKLEDEAETGREI